MAAKKIRLPLELTVRNKLKKKYPGSFAVMSLADSMVELSVHYSDKPPILIACGKDKTLLLELVDKMIK
jgi:hypothetical protein